MIFRTRTAAQHPMADVHRDFPADPRGWR
jgi:hypothetical protein